MPGGHLATAAALGACAYFQTGSIDLVVGCVAGAFLIDVDHYLDYLFVEGQWRRPFPADFLKYYFTAAPRMFVLPLHSFELMAVLTGVATMSGSELLIGYLLGAVVHLVCDIVVNGDHALKRPFLFYLFSYRAFHRFDATKFLDVVSIKPGAGSHPYREFFTWRPPTNR